MIRKLARYGILLAMLLVLDGCDVASDLSDKPSPDWSRGLRLGVSPLNQPVALQVDGEGHTHLVWYTKAEEVSKLHYAQLDDQAKVVMERDLNIPLFDPHKPQLLLDRQGNMHLAFLAREEGAKSLFHFLLGYDGEVLSEPTRLSPPTSGGDKGGEVKDYQMCLGQEGRIEVFWSDKEGIVHLGLDGRGEVISAPTLIVPRGMNPSAQVDRAGTIHLAWFQEPSPQSQELYYTALQGLGQRPSPNEVKGTKLTQFGTGMSAGLYGPVLGLDMGNVYIFWALEQRAGLEVGTAKSFYVSFPLGSGQARLTPTRVNIVNSDFVTMPSVAGGQQNELAAMFTVWLGPSDLRTTTKSPSLLSVGKPTMQLAMGVFTESKVRGYQLAAETGSFSLRPNLVVDPALRQPFDPSTLPFDSAQDKLRAGSAQDKAQDTALSLYLTWLDTAGFGRYDVYYASTSPEAKAWLDRTHPKDVLLKAADLALGMLSGLALLPLVALWLFLPLLLLVLFYVFVGEEELELRRVKVALGIAIVLYMGVKLVILPSSLLHFSFLDQVPSQLSSVLVSGVPLIILALAVAAITAYQRRAERATLFPAFLIFAATDALLSLVIYAPAIFGVGG